MPPAPRVALVTYAGLPEGSREDALLRPALAAHGITGVPAVWDDPAVDWAAFRLVVIRSAWDYHLRRAAFVAWAERVAGLTTLLNPAPLVRWNSHKGYLRDLAAAGIPIVPTIWLPAGGPADLAAILAGAGWTRAVVKPAVSASAQGTMLVTPATLDAGQAHVDRLLPAHDLLVQPFLEAVSGYGERSLLFAGGTLTHAVRRPPMLEPAADPAEDSLRAVTPNAAECALARRVLAAVPGPLLYARVDLVPDAAGRLCLMELELIEPALFLSLAPAAPAMFAAAIAACVKREMYPTSRKDGPMHREPLESSSILTAGYDPAARTLELEFRNHRVYRYMDVPPEVWAGLRAAESAGAYFVQTIRNDYECWRLVNRAGVKHQGVPA